MIQLLANVHSHSSTGRQLHVFISFLQLLKSATLTWSLWSDWERMRLEQLTGWVAGSQSTSWCPFVEDAYLVSRRYGGGLNLASFPGARKIGGSAWYTLFAHAQSLHGNLHTTRYTKHALTKRSISVYLLISHTAELCSL